MVALGAFLSGLLLAAQTSLTPVVGLAGLLIGGAVYATGNQQVGKSLIIAALIGTAIMLLAGTIMTQLMALPRA